MDQHVDQPIPPPQNLPDFGLIAREFQKCSQLPAFDQGAAILRSLTQIQTSIQGLNQRVDGLSLRVDGLSRRIDGIDDRLASQDHNIMARLQNAKKANLTDNLVPLHDRLNQPIDHFPNTILAIDRLRTEDLSRILVALGSDINGPVAEKRSALRMALGLHTV